MLVIDVEQKVRLFKIMLESRQGDLRELNLIRQGQGHFQITGMGHESLAALGIQLEPQDYVFPFYRDRALLLGRGMTTHEIALAYLAKRDSSSGGRQMPCHYSHRPLNVFSHPSPTGSHLLPACGVAWGMKLSGDSGVTVATSGEAATRQGDFFEAICLAREKQLPMLFVVEDNGYGISNCTRRNSPRALEVLNNSQWDEVDGADPLAVYDAAEKALAKARSGGGPAFLWIRVERLMSHSSSDDQRVYRPAAELEALASRDPVEAFKRHLVGEEGIDPGAIESWEEELREEVRAIYQRAGTADDPRRDDLALHTTGTPAHCPDERLLEPGRYRMADAVNKILGKALMDEPRAIIYGEDVEDPKGGVFKLTKNLSSEFPDRVFNSPLAESTILGVCCGLAAYGMRPVFEVQFIDFIAPGWNQLVTNLATLRWRSFGHWSCPSVIYAPYGAYLPAGGIWHSQANESALAHFPGLKVVVPSTPEDTAGLFWSALKDEDPVIILLAKHLIWAEREITEAVHPVPLGKLRRVRAGHDVTVVAWGNTLELAEAAARELEPDISVEVLDLRSIVPWDREGVLEAVRRTRRLVVVQEDTECCSVGQMIITAVTSDPELWAALAAPPRLVSKGDVMVGYNPILEYAALPSREEVIAAIREALSSEAAPRAATAEGGNGTSATRKLTPGKGAPPSSPQSPAPALRYETVKVPNLGEGVYEATVVTLAKSPGDKIRPDDMLCEVETDKAVFPVESPLGGELVEWKIEVDSVVSTGDEVAVLVVEQPFTRAGEGYHYVTSAEEPAPVETSAATGEEAQRPHYTEVEPALSPRITSRARDVVMTNIVVNARWHAMRQARRDIRAGFSPIRRISPSMIAAWCILQTMKGHSAFRRLVLPPERIVEPEHFDFGIAVALKDDRLQTGVIPEADRLDWPAFVQAYSDAVERAHHGDGGSKANTPLIVTSMGAMGVRFGMPIVVPPCIATLFVGSSFHELLPREDGELVPTECVTLSLTFDHRVANGAGAAAFLGEARQRIESFRLPGAEEAEKNRE